MFRLVVLASIFSVLPIAGRAQVCSDIRRFDFKNATIPIAGPDEGGFAGVRVFRLQDGTGFQSDDSPDEHDWQLSLLSDRLEHPDQGTWVRIIEVERKHLTGTGDWHYIFAFDCARGQLETLFQYGAEGVVLEQAGDGKLVLRQAVWVGDDAHCCPSSNQQKAYLWDARRHRYNRISTASASSRYPPEPGR
jgi:hypothetical protein